MFNEIQFSFIETFQFIEIELDISISDENSERFEIVSNLFKKFEIKYPEIETQKSEMYNFILDFLQS